MSSGIGNLLFVFIPISSECEDMKKLVYLCPICNYKLESHIRGELCEIKKLKHMKCNAIMNWTVVDAHIETKRAKSKV